MLGLDVAAVDGNVGTDWHAARAAGAHFAYLKKSQHVYPDAYYAAEAQRARDAGLVVGAYHFPGWGPRAAPAKSQVAAFRAAPGTILPGEDLPPAIDVEGGSGGFASYGVPKSELVEQVRQLVLEVEDQLSVTPAIYISYNQYYDLGCPAMTPWAARCPLWVKTAYRLRANQPVDQVAPPEPHAGLDALRDPRNYYRIPDPWAQSGWWIQQWQGDATGHPGFSRTVDMDLLCVARPGDRGPQVAWLQRRLGVAADGDFGPATQAAVRALQAARGLVVDGEVGPRTFAAIAWQPAK